MKAWSKYAYKIFNFGTKTRTCTIIQICFTLGKENIWAKNDNIGVQLKLIDASPTICDNISNVSKSKICKLP